MRSDYCRRAISVVEVLIVVSIIGMLVALAMPAVQAARETARRAKCVNSLRQLGLGAMLHHDTHHHFPTNGWGYLWVGDPDRGFGKNQPGGWIYNLLPYVEQGAVHDIPKGHQQGSEAKAAATAVMLKTSVSGFNCPSRREPLLVSTHDPFEARNSEPVHFCYRSDYAANGGDHYCDAKGGMTSGPETHDEAKEDEWLEEFHRLQVDCNGIAHPQSTVAYRQILDGTSKTYLLGEKYVHSEHYSSGMHVGDRRSMLMGANLEINRWGAEPPRYDLTEVDRQAHSSFGSAHPRVFNMAYCDGSVRAVHYEVDEIVHKTASNRRDDETPEQRREREAEDMEESS